MNVDFKGIREMVRTWKIYDLLLLSLALFYIDPPASLRELTSNKNVINLTQPIKGLFHQKNNVELLTIK